MCASLDRRGLSPPNDAVRVRFLDHVREVGTMNEEEATRAFEAVPPAQLNAFREMLALDGSRPVAIERLARLIAEVAPRPGDSLSRVTAAAPSPECIRWSRLIAQRTFHRVHSDALGTGALALWNFPRVNAARHWRHGHATGLIALISHDHDSILRDRVYTAGLLHDIGSLATAQLGPREDREPPGDRERAFYRAAMGSAISARLGFPRWLCSALLPCGIEPYVDDKLDRVVSAACHVAHLAEFPGLLTDEGRSFAAMPDVKTVSDALKRAGGSKWLEENALGPLLTARIASAAAFVRV